MRLFAGIYKFTNSPFLKGVVHITPPPFEFLVRKSLPGVTGTRPADGEEILLLFLTTCWNWFKQFLARGSENVGRTQSHLYSPAMEPVTPPIYREPVGTPRYFRERKEGTVLDGQL